MLASKGHIQIGRLLATLAGISLVIGSACVVNNFIDRDIDAKMARTKNRALARGSISARSAIIFASLLGAVGFLILIVFTNLLTVLAGLTGFLVYDLAYSFSKRLTAHSTLIGSISGAMPPVAGYLAVTDHIDAGAWLLLLILVFWQMPHFYAIAMRRQDEYRAAGLPVLPVKHGLKQTKVQVLLYVIGFIVVSSLFTILGYTGYIYLAVMLIAGLWWLRIGWRGFARKDEKTWAKQMFLYSLVVLLVFCVMLSVNTWLV